MVNIKIAFRCMAKEKLGKLFTAYIGPNLENASKVWLWHLKKQRSNIEGLTEINKDEPDTRERLEAVGLPTVEKRRIKGDRISSF